VLLEPTVDVWEVCRPWPGSSKRQQQGYLSFIAGPCTDPTSTLLNLMPFLLLVVYFHESAMHGSLHVQPSPTVACVCSCELQCCLLQARATSQAHATQENNNNHLHDSITCLRICGCIPAVCTSQKARQSATAWTDKQLCIGVSLAALSRVFQRKRILL
jgi:hypothetical protein